MPRAVASARYWWIGGAPLPATRNFRRTRVSFSDADPSCPGYHHTPRAMWYGLHLSRFASAADSHMLGSHSQSSEGDRIKMECGPNK